MTFRIFLVFILLFAAFLFFARLGKYHEFHKAEINGKIDTVYAYKDYVMIFVNKVEYRIIPVSLNNAPELYRNAHIGDEILKKTNSDTLTLIDRQNKIFNYSVKKF